MRCIDFDETGRRRLPLNQTCRRLWDQAVMPGHETHYRQADAGQRLSNVTVGNRVEAAANGLRRHAAKSFQQRLEEIPCAIQAGEEDQGRHNKAAAARSLIGHLNASQLSARSGALIRAQIDATVSSALESAVSITQ